MLNVGCCFFLLMLLLCVVLCCECNDAGDPVDAASLHYAAPGNLMRSAPRKVRETVLSSPCVCRCCAACAALIAHGGGACCDARTRAATRSDVEDALTRANSQFLQEERERWSATEAKGRSAPKNMRFVQGPAGPRFATLTRQACRLDLGLWRGLNSLKRTCASHSTNPPDITGRRSGARESQKICIKPKSVHRDVFDGVHVTKIPRQDGQRGVGRQNRAHGSSQIDESEKAPTMSCLANDVEEAPPWSQH
jgi:hypothetical protein